MYLLVLLYCTQHWSAPVVQRVLAAAALLSYGLPVIALYSNIHMLHYKMVLSIIPCTRAFFFTGCTTDPCSNRRFRLVVPLPGGADSGLSGAESPNESSINSLAFFASSSDTTIPFHFLDLPDLLFLITTTLSPTMGIPHSRFLPSTIFSNGTWKIASCHCLRPSVYLTFMMINGTGVAIYRTEERLERDFQLQIPIRVNTTD